MLTANKHTRDKLVRTAMLFFFYITYVLEVHVHNKMMKLSKKNDKLEMCIPVLRSTLSVLHFMSFEYIGLRSSARTMGEVAL